MARASGVLRRVEIALWVLGLLLLGAALGATLFRWQYQLREERALFGPAAGDGSSVTSLPSPRAVAAGRESREVQGPHGALTVPALPSDRADAGSSPALTRRERPRRRSDADPSAFGRIEIPRLGLAAIVRDGSDESTLARAVGRIPGTAQPGEHGNMVLAGHRDTFFRPLRGIRVNDRIRIVVPPETYEYRVDSLRVVSPEETSVLASRGVEELTLVTCYPFRFVGPAPERFIVSASRID